MLTTAALLKLAGLVVKQTNGKFILGPNATKRHVFLYGDGLSVSLYSTIYDKILRQITWLHNEKYFGTLLDAQDCIFTQKGAFTSAGRMLLEKTIRKARLTYLRRRQRKRELIYNSMKYFSAQMAKRNKQLHCSMERSADKTAVYAAPWWKQNYKNRLANYND